MSLLLYSVPDVMPRHVQHEQRSAASPARQVPQTVPTVTRAWLPVGPDMLRRVLDGLKRL